MSWKGDDDYYTRVCSFLTIQSDKKGFFQGFIDNVTETAGPAWIEEFGRLRTDEERITKCFYDEKIFEAVHGPLSNVQTLFRGKHTQIAQQRRLEGVRAVKSGKLEKALQLFSQSVVRAPRNDEAQTFAFVLWERSQVLLSLKEFDLALADIQLSLKAKLPESYRINAYWAMVDCYIGLKEYNKANISMKVVSKLTEGDSQWKEKIDEKIQALQKMTISNETDDKVTGELPLLSDGINPDLPSTSKLIAMESSKAAGRFIVAKFPIKAGDTLAVEEPFAAALLPDKFNSHCLHCFKRVRAAIPCDKCSGITFCSEVCKDNASSTYHKYECSFLDMLLGSGMSILCHISLRIFTRASLNNFLELKPKLGSDTTSHPYLRFYSLVSHKQLRSAEDFLHRTLMALFLLRILQAAGYFGKSYDKEELTPNETFVGGLLLHQLQSLQFNAHEIYETVMKELTQYQSAKLNNIGVGVYTSVALFNHDCYPAVTRYFSGNKLILKAVRPLNPGEGVSENYGPIFTKKTFKERQQSLKSRYWFTCNCTACSEDWKTYDETDEAFYQIRCQDKKCNGYVRISARSPGKQKIKCPVCQKMINIEEIILLIKTYVDDHRLALSAMDKGNVTEAANLLSQYSNTMHSICRPPNKYLCLTQEALRFCWVLNGRGTVYIVP